MQPRHPDFAARVARSFALQPMMGTIGATITRVEAGIVEIVLPVRPELTQQHGFVHAGAIAAIADTAAGYAALSLMPAAVGVLTAEFKINLLAPAAGDRLVAIGRVVKPGRTLTVAQAEVHAEGDGRRKLVAILNGTLMAIEGREGIVD
jgi:uncharacterized protein (TIGR00369 family)